MTKKKMFPLDLTNVESALVVSEQHNSKLWHLRYGHLKVKGLQLLGQKVWFIDYQKLINSIYVSDAHMESK